MHATSTDQPNPVAIPTLPEDLHAQVSRLRALRQLSLALFESADQTAVVTAALDGAIDLFGAESASFWADQDDHLVCQVTRGKAGDALDGARLSREMLLAPDPSGQVLATPVSIAGTEVGAIRVARGALARGPAYGPLDREALEDLADSVAAALHAAVRAESNGSRQNLELVLEMSREIGSSLDLDRVLRTVVNLAARAVEFDRGAVALYENGKCDIRAVAGADTVDAKSPEMQDLAVRASWAIGVGQRFYLSNRTEPSTDAERIFLQIFSQDLETAQAMSGFYLPLTDEEGVVGILVFEAERADFATEEQQELLTILANQTTVAIRNAQLYARVPMADALSAFAMKRRELMAIPRRKRWLSAAVVAVALAILSLIQWPYRVAAVAPTFRPAGQAEIRAMISGVVEQVLVREGSTVERGAPVAQLRGTESQAQRDALSAAVAGADRAAALAASRQDAAEERLQRIRAASLRNELAVESARGQLLTLRAPMNGTVLTARPEERVGASLDAGEALVLVGRTDSLELDFGVEQREI
ncbi:MAG: GAF domain-containing protein, partial [Gemmatimonadota bacterium]